MTDHPAGKPRTTGTVADCPLCGDIIYNSTASWRGHFAISHGEAAAPPEPPRTDRRNGVCAEHDAPAYVWPDGSVDCIYCCHVETSCNCTEAAAAPPVNGSRQSDRIPRTADQFLDEEYTYVEPRFAAAFRDGWNAHEREIAAPPPSTIRENW